MLHYREDWDAARRRIEAWYQREVVETCAIWVQGRRRSTVRKVVPAPEALVDRWTNIDYLLRKAEERMRCTFYGGEGFPLVLRNLGPSAFSAWLGCPLTFSEDTTWTSPIIDDWDTFGGLSFDQRNKWWVCIEQATRVAAERGRGRFIVGLTDIHGGGDALAALRGT